IDNFRAGKPIPILHFPIRKSDCSQNKLLPIIASRLPIYTDGYDNFLAYISAQVEVKICVTPRSIGTGFAYFLRFRLGGVQIDHLYTEIGWCRGICIMGLKP